MIRIRNGKVVKVFDGNQEIQRALLIIDGKEAKVINYPCLTGKIQVGDIVQVNTTAVTLGLGTGGYHFVIANLNNTANDCAEKGHIMKIRYTPHQVKVLAAEESSSPYHERIKNFTSLNNTPVIIGFLHSMLLPAIAGVKVVNQNHNISYVMTDSGALPIAFSKTIRQIKGINWLKGTVTVGHAFGGDLEAINVYSGLATAFIAQKADIIIVAMGPGNVGTGTELGTTALEVGQIINAVYSLGGLPIVIPRINFKDHRKRHQGISHHVITVLKKIALVKSTVVFPKLNNTERMDFLKQQISNNEIAKQHNIIFENGYPGLTHLKTHCLEVTTMGRGFTDEEEFFLAACAAGTFAAKLV